MESHRSQSNLFLSLLFLSFSLFSLSVDSLSTQGTIERTTKQQLLASIPPDAVEGASVLFITSPSGKFEGYFLRRETTPGAGGFGNDFCYIQIQESGQSVWESECSPVSTANTCSLVFTDAGLETFDGSRSSWNTGADGDHLHTLVLVDSGDMQIRDKDGELDWKASDEPRRNQECGSVGSPGLGSAHAPFAHPIGDSNVFGQPDPIQEQPTGSQQQPQQQPLGYQQQQPLSQPFSGSSQALGANNQNPLIDNTPFDSGSSREMASMCGVGLGFLIAFFCLALLA